MNVRTIILVRFLVAIFRVHQVGPGLWQRIGKVVVPGVPDPLDHLLDRIFLGKWKVTIIVWFYHVKHRGPHLTSHLVENQLALNFFLARRELLPEPDGADTQIKFFITIYFVLAL